MLAIRPPGIQQIAARLSTDMSPCCFPRAAAPPRVRGGGPRRPPAPPRSPPRQAATRNCTYISMENEGEEGGVEEEKDGEDEAMAIAWGWMGSKARAGQAWMGFGGACSKARA